MVFGKKHGELTKPQVGFSYGNGFLLTKRSFIKSLDEKAANITG